MQHSPRQAFTIVELVVAVTIIGLLALLTIVAATSYRHHSNAIRCTNNLRSIGAATTVYAGEHRGELPYYYYKTNEKAGSGAIGGTWYYNLAPYLGVSRTEVETPSAHSERTRLGTASQRITAPCVFTCPAHKPEESRASWKPVPMTWPSDVPVSYAPPTYAKKSPDFADMEDGKLYARRLSDVRYPSRKIWLADSPTPTVLNTSAGRWSPDGGSEYNFPYQGFTRHKMGGNALFFDGHIEWLSVTTFTNYPAGKNPITRYFNTDIDPSLH